MALNKWGRGGKGRRRRGGALADAGGISKSDSSRLVPDTRDDTRRDVAGCLRCGGGPDVGTREVIRDLCCT